MWSEPYSPLDIHFKITNMPLNKRCDPGTPLTWALKLWTPESPLKVRSCKFIYVWLSYTTKMIFLSIIIKRQWIQDTFEKGNNDWPCLVALGEFLPQNATCWWVFISETLATHQIYEWTHIKSRIFIMDMMQTHSLNNFNNDVDSSV